MRAIAGLLTPKAGTIRLDGADVTRVPANRREVGLVVQSYALFPHLTVFENVAFGLRLRRTPETEIGERVKSALTSVGLAAFGARRPAELSGGQQQRVALARSMIMRPKILLLDEPLSNLDARLRLEMRTELQRVQKESGVTMVFVTHDQSEALALADRIVVMVNGAVEQIGPPEEIYNAPISAFVADFVGFENIFKVEDGRMVGPAGPATPSGSIAPTVKGLAWRPNAVTLGEGPFQGTVRGSSFAGATREYLLDTPLGPIKAVVPASDAVYPLGTTLSFDLRVEKAVQLSRFG